MKCALESTILCRVCFNADLPDTRAIFCFVLPPLPKMKASRLLQTILKCSRLHQGSLCQLPTQTMYSYQKNHWKLKIIVHLHCFNLFHPFKRGNLMTPVITLVMPFKQCRLVGLSVYSRVEKQNLCRNIGFVLRLSINPHLLKAPQASPDAGHPFQPPSSHLIGCHQGAVSASSNCRRIRCCSPFLASAWQIWPMWHFWNTLTTQTNKYSFQRNVKRLTKEVFETSGYVWTCECRSTKFEQNLGSTLTATFRLRPTGMESCTGQWFVGGHNESPRIE